MLRLCLCLLLVALAVSARAQQAVVEPIQIQPSGQAYVAALRFRGIETDVAFFDPSAPPPDFDTLQAPPPPKPTAAPFSTGARLAWIAVTVVILGVLGFLVHRYGGGLAISLRRETANLGRGRTRPPDVPAPHGGPPDSLAAILALADRRAALVALAQGALARTVAANGVLQPASWTARDALRHIPGAQAHLDALRDLVFAAERVQFGGRDVSEEAFRAHVARVRPLFGGSAA